MPKLKAKPKVLKGNQTDQLYASMGVQQEGNMTRSGQSCYITLYMPSDDTASKIKDATEFSPVKDVLDNDMGEPSGPIDAVMQAVMDNLHSLHA